MMRLLKEVRYEMNLIQSLKETEDLKLFYEMQVLLHQCDLYQKQIDMSVYLEHAGIFLEVETNAAETSQSDPNVKDTKEAPQTNPEAKKETTPQDTTEKGFLDKVLDTVKKIFMFIPNLVTKCIEKIVDKKLEESKQTVIQLDQLSDQQIDALLTKIEQRKTESQTKEDQVEESVIEQFPISDSFYQELGTAIGAGLGIKGARAIASNEIARQKVMANSMGENLTDKELAKRSAIGAIEPVVKQAASIGAKTAAVAGAAAVGGHGLVLVGVGLLASVGAGKLWDKVSNTIKDARDKNRITQLPDYSLIEKVFQSKDKELTDKIGLLQNGIGKQDPNASQQNLTQSLQVILQKFTIVDDKESEQILRAMNLFFEKYIKPSPLLNQQQKGETVSEMTPADEQALSECEKFSKEMNNQTFIPLLQDLKQKSEQLINWFNDPSNPIFGVMSQKRYVQSVAQQARAEKGIAEDTSENPIKQKILGLLTSLGKKVMSMINIVMSIIRIGSDMLQTVANGINILKQS